MDLKKSEYFLAVAREESITRAAEKIPITQPALTRAIQSPEEELRKKFFVHKKYSVKLTTEGLELFQDAAKILSLAREIETKFKTEGNIYGDIYIGCAESQAMKYFARTAKNIRAKYPNVRFNLYSGNVEDNYFRLDNELLDFNITLQKVDLLKYDCLNLPSPDIWGVILRRDDPLAAKKTFTVEDLIELPLILSREGMLEEYPQWFGNAFEKIKIAATFNLVYNAAIMVREGLGYSISIDNLVNDPQLCFCPLEPELKSELRIIRRKDRVLTPQAQIFFDEMQKENFHER